MSEVEQLENPSAPDGMGMMHHPDDDVTWGEALTGLNPSGFGSGSWAPWENVFWRSLAKNIKDTAFGLPQLPVIAYSLVKEVPAFYHQVSGIVAENLGDGTAFVKALEEAGAPTFAALIGDYIDRYGSLQGFKTALATDPVSIIADVVGLVPGAGGAKIAQASTRTGRILRAAQKGANVVDDVINVGAIAAQKGLGAGAKKVQKAFAMDPSKYNIPIKVRTGQFDEATGQPITEMITPRELAQKLSEISGTEITPDDLPIQALTDNEIPLIFEEVLRRTEAEMAPKIAAEYDAASEMTKGVQSELVAKYPTRFKKYWNPSSVGQFLQDHYMKTQQGEKGRMGQLFEQNENDLDVELPQSIKPEVTPPLVIPGEQPVGRLAADLSDLPVLRRALPRAEAFVEELLKKYGGKIENVTNPDTLKTITTYREIAEKLSKIDKVTYNTLRTLRTDFAYQIDLFGKDGQMLKTGEGSVSKKLYNQITQDIFDQLEAAAEANPGVFPEDMIARVKSANAEWRDWIQLGNTEAAKWLWNNVNDPGGMMDKLLAKDNSLVDIEIDNLRRLIGDEWSTFQKALLNRLLERSMRGDVETPLGLKSQLENINWKNKYQLTQIFGEDTARILNEISTFRERTFGPKGQWNTPYAQEIIKKYLNDPDFTNILFATGMMSDATSQAVHSVIDASGAKSGNILGISVSLAFKAIFTGFVGAAYYVPQKIARKKLVSGGYRQWMTEGYEYKYQIPGGKGEITLNSESFRIAEDLVNKYGWATFYPGRVAVRTAREKKEREASRQFQGMPQDKE